MTELRTVAALYCDPRGPYPRMAGVDAWDLARDARNYAGPHPVVAHPPCAPFSRLKHMERDPGAVAADLECGPIAVAQVRRWGGVLEQPARSKLWAYCGLPGPSTSNDARCRVCGHFELGFARADALYAHCPSCDRAPHWQRVPNPTDAHGGFALEVEQVAWGHVARKPTWLYLVGVPYALAMEGVRTGGTPTHWCSGGRKRSSGSGGLVPPGIKVCSAQQRRRTPVEFASWLVSLARASTVSQPERSAP